MTVLEELVLRITTQVRDNELRAADKRLSGMVTTAKNLAKSLASAFAVREVQRFVTTQIELGDELGKTSRRLGVTAGQLNAMRFAADRAGIDHTRLNDVLKDINKNVGEAQNGNQLYIKALDDLGISARTATGENKSLVEVFGEIIEAKDGFESTSAAAAALTRIAGESGQFLAQTDFEDFAKDIALAGEQAEGINERTKAFEEASNDIAEMDLALNELKATVAEVLLPAIKPLTGAVRDFAKFVKSAGGESVIAGGGVLVLVKALSVLLSPFRGLLKLVPSVTGSMGKMGGASTRLAGPLALGAVFVALLDVKSALEGGDSAIIDFGNSLNNLIDQGQGEGGILDFLGKVRSKVSDAFASVGAFFGSNLAQEEAEFSSVRPDLRQGGFATNAQASAAAQSGSASNRDQVGFISSSMLQARQNAANSIGGAGSGSATTNNNTNNNTSNITINARNADAREVAREVRRQQDRHNRAAVENNASSVRAGESL